MTRKLDKIWEAYEYQNATGNKYFITIKLLLKRRKIKDALAEAEKGISFQYERGEELRALHFLGLKSIIQILQQDLNGANISFKQVEEIISKKGRVSTYYIISYFMGRLLFDLNLLEKAIHSETRVTISKQKKKAYASAKKALKTANKCSLDKTEALKLMGTFFWLINKQKKALKYWQDSIYVGKKIGSSVELSRTYFEVGKRLFEQKSTFDQLNKIKRKDYLLKARSAFQTMNLQQDLQELNRFADSGNIEL
ncbi:MAG: hypothetical protein SWH54_05375 [Thermodesulfobacteriota bacterium]|nr:hypothetical protein [Thermodesulfobacteriota bacterium]